MIYGSLLQCHFLTGQTGFLRGNTHCVALHRNIDGCSRLCVTAHIAMGIMGGMHRLNVVDALEVAQGTVNAKITEEKSKGAPKKGRKRFALSSRTKKCIPIVMAQESEICRIAQY